MKKFNGDAPDWKPEVEINKNIYLTYHLADMALMERINRETCLSGMAIVSKLFENKDKLGFIYKVNEIPDTGLGFGVIPEGVSRDDYWLATFRFKDLNGNIIDAEDEDLVIPEIRLCGEYPIKGVTYRRTINDKYIISLICANFIARRDINKDYWEYSVSVKLDHEKKEVTFMYYLKQY